MEKTRQVSEEALKSQVNVAKSTQGAKARSRGNFDNWGRGYFRGRGQGNYRNRGCRNFNQGRDNNFRAEWVTPFELPIKKINSHFHP